MTNEKRRSTILLALAAASVAATSHMGRAIAASATAATVPPPPDLLHTQFADVRQWVGNVTNTAPANMAAHAAFVKRKLFTAFTHPAANKDARDQLVLQVVARFGAQANGMLDKPTPGGVGYGMFYTEDFKQAWGAGTSTSYDLICPSSPGGNVDNYLYLTTTNRAGFGVEAFVSYFGQTEPSFKIFDWAQAATNPWQVNVPFSALEAYLFPRAKSRSAPQALSVWNTTYSLGGRFYRNEVHLYNHFRHGWDLVYQFDYAADDASQKNSWIGSWGPIVETFQSIYSNTYPMGAKRTLLTESDNYGRWNNWSLLQAPESTIRNDNVGFSTRNVAPNFAFVVLS